MNGKQRAVTIVTLLVSGLFFTDWISFKKGHTPG